MNLGYKGGGCHPDFLLFISSQHKFSKVNIDLTHLDDQRFNKDPLGNDDYKSLLSIYAYARDEIERRLREK